MHPSRVFEKHLIENPETCNFCFRKKAAREEFPYPEAEIPDFISPRIFPTEDSVTDYPPPETGDIGRTIEIDYYNKRTGTSSRKIDSGGEGRNEPIRGMISKPKIVCDCGRMDDRRIDGEFPDDWESRPKENLVDVSRRIYHRLDEQGFNLDFDDFKSRVEFYKTSDEYDFGDYEVLQDAVADAVSVKQQEI